MAAGYWRPTHVVRVPGLPSYPEPRAAAGVVANLQRGLQVEVLQLSTGWAWIRCENGWETWVNAQGLEPLTPARPPPQQVAAPSPQAAAYAPAPAPTPASVPAYAPGPGPAGPVPAVDGGPVTAAGPSRQFAVVSACLCGALILTILLPWIGFGGVDRGGLQLANDLRGDLGTLEGRTKLLGYALQGLYPAMGAAALAAVLHLTGNAAARHAQLLAAVLTALALLFTITDDNVDTQLIKYGFWGAAAVTVALVFAQRMDRWTTGGGTP